MIKEEKEEEKRNKNFLAVARKRLTQAGNYEILPVTIKEEKEKKGSRKKVFVRGKKPLDTSGKV